MNPINGKVNQIVIKATFENIPLCLAVKKKKFGLKTFRESGII